MGINAKAQKYIPPNYWDCLDNHAYNIYTIVTAGIHHK